MQARASVHWWCPYRPVLQTATASRNGWRQIPPFGLSMHRERSEPKFARNNRISDSNCDQASDTCQGFQLRTLQLPPSAWKHIPVRVYITVYTRPGTRVQWEPDNSETGMGGA